MTQQSLSNSQEASSSASSSGNSASTSATDVYPLPFSFGQKEIVQNSDERRLVTDFIDNNVVAPLAPGANICITDSSDVLVGNPTYFNSDVTIYQYINGNRLPELQNGGVPGQDEVQCNKNVTVINLEKPTTNTRTVTVQHDRCKGRRKFNLIISSITVITVIAFIASPILLPKSPSKKASTDLLETTITPTITPIPGSDADVYIPRGKWGGREHAGSITIPPATLVVVKHTGGSICTDVESCRSRVREIQRAHMEDYNFSDISYNFLIGGDGKIYVGRGFRVRNEGRGDSMDIVFIGNFTTSSPTVDMLQLGRRLVIKATSPRVNAVDFSTYHVINHNQTEKTDSPGETLFRAVTTWDYYSGNLYFNDSN